MFICISYNAKGNSQFCILLLFYKSVSILEFHNLLIIEYMSIEQAVYERRCKDEYLVTRLVREHVKFLKLQSNS